MFTMTDDSFARLVGEDVKGRCTPAQRDFLLMPDNWGRWKRALILLVEVLQRQLVDVADEEQVEVDRYKAMGSMGTQLAASVVVSSEERRRKIKRFLFFVEQRLDEVVRMAGIDDDGGDDSEERLSSFLRKAIEKHRELLQKFDVDSGPIDEALYLALQGRWEFDLIQESDFGDDE